MNKTGIVIITIILFLITAAMVARQFVPVPPYDPGQVATFRFMLNLSTSQEAKEIKAELAGASVELARSKAAAVAAGISLQPPPVTYPESENAYPLYAKWYDAKRRKIAASYPLYADPMSIGWSYTPEQIAAVQKICSENSVNDTVLTQALQKPYFAPPSPMDSPMDGIGGFAALREASRVITTKSALLYLAGRPRDAILMQKLGLRIGVHLEQAHTMIGHANAEGVDAVIISGISRILAHSRPNVATSALVSSIIGGYSTSDSFKLSLVGEVPSWNHLIGLSLSTAPLNVFYNPKKMSRADGKVADQVLEVCEARIIDSLTAAVKVADDQPTKRRLEFKAIDKAASLAGDDPVAGAFGSLANYSKYEQNEDVRLAERSILLAACSVLTVKARTGKYPEALPGDFLDLFSGKNVKYRLYGKGFVVYSVGPSGTYDGVPAHKTSWDTLFHYPAPPPPPLPADLADP